MRRIRDQYKPDLLVIPDASGTFDQYKALNDLGIDIIVLDHHVMEERGDGVHTIVVNNQQSEKYTNKDFSGVGVVWQFCRVLDEKLTFVCADTYLDLLAIGNISDVMDMRSDETRFLCNLGMQNSNINSNLVHYLQMNSFSMRDGKYNPHVIAFSIAPYFNAVCRIGDMEEKEMLFKCLIDAQAFSMVQSGKRGHTNEQVQLVEEGWRLASNAKGRQDTRKNKLATQIDEVINQERLFDNQVIVLAFDDFKEEYRALSGLTCNRLIEIYNRPVILTFKNEDGSYTGSCRAPDNIPAYADFRSQCEQSKLFKYASGHPLAFGVAFPAENTQKIIAYFENKLSGIDLTVSEKVDFVFDADDPEICDMIEELTMYENIWGQNIDAPKIAIKNVKMGCGKMSLIGSKKNTLKIAYPFYELINFNSSEAEYDSLKLPYDGIEQYYTATVICHSPSVNEFAGTRTPQLQFETYQLGDVRYDF